VTVPEPDHWRTLLEITNAVVTKRDLAQLRAAIAPNVNRLVPHDHTNLFLVDEHARLQAFVVDPAALAWPEHLSDSIRLDAEPYKSWLVRAVDIDVAGADPKGWKPLHAHIVASGVKRVCNVPLSAPHGVLGVSLGRLTSAPFTQDELDRVTQVAAQIAIALENATAFDEIASLKEQLAHENVYLKEVIRGVHQFEEIIGESNALQRVLNQIRSVAATTRRSCCSARRGPARNCSRVLVRRIREVLAANQRPHV
jgi:formate hydrogenlyase transcriptional activator